MHGLLELVGHRYPTRRTDALFVAMRALVTFVSAIAGAAASPQVPLSPVFFAGLGLAVAVLL
jgi:hypothetical protein